MLIELKNIHKTYDNGQPVVICPAELVAPLPPAPGLRYLKEQAPL